MISIDCQSHHQRNIEKIELIARCSFDERLTDVYIHCLYRKDPIKRNTVPDNNQFINDKKKRLNVGNFVAEGDF